MRYKMLISIKELVANISLSIVTNFTLKKFQQNNRVRAKGLYLQQQAKTINNVNIIYNQSSKKPIKIYYDLWKPYFTWQKV